MHRKPESDLFPLDTDLERTLRNLRKVRSAETTIMVDEIMGQTINQETTTERPLMQGTMEDFWRPVIQEEYSAIRQPAIEANNFELKLALISMVQQNQFTDPNEHMGRFLRIANTVKLNGVRLEVIEL